MMIEFETSEGTELNTESLSITVDGETCTVDKKEDLNKLEEHVQDGKAFIMDSDNVESLIAPVESSNIGHMFWNQKCLYLTFKTKNGFSLYGYTEVPSDIALRLANAE